MKEQLFISILLIVSIIATSCKSKRPEIKVSPHTSGQCSITSKTNIPVDKLSKEDLIAYNLNWQVTIPKRPKKDLYVADTIIISNPIIPRTKRIKIIANKIIFTANGYINVSGSSYGENGGYVELLAYEIEDLRKSKTLPIIMANGANGRPGENALPGKKGKDGQEIKLNIKLHPISTKKNKKTKKQLWKLTLSNLKTKKVIKTWKLNSKPTTKKILNLIKPIINKYKNLINGQDGTDATAAKPGTKGGNAGKIKITYVVSNTSIKVKASPGKGGKGGKGAKGGQGGKPGFILAYYNKKQILKLNGKPGNSGKNAPDAKNGPDGKQISPTISKVPKENYVSVVASTPLPYMTFRLAVRDIYLNNPKAKEKITFYKPIWNRINPFLNEFIDTKINLKSLGLTYTGLWPNYIPLPSDVKLPATRSTSNKHTLPKKINLNTKDLSNCIAALKNYSHILAATYSYITQNLLKLQETNSSELSELAKDLKHFEETALLNDISKRYKWFTNLFGDFKVKEKQEVNVTIPSSYTDQLNKCFMHKKTKCLTSCITFSELSLGVINRVVLSKITTKRLKRGLFTIMPKVTIKVFPLSYLEIDGNNYSFNYLNPLKFLSDPLTYIYDYDLILSGDTMEITGLSIKRPSIPFYTHSCFVIEVSGWEGFKLEGIKLKLELDKLGK